MAEQTQLTETTVRPLKDVLKEVEQMILTERSQTAGVSPNIKDLRWKFDQVSAKMNQAIYNDQRDQIHSSCLQTVAVLIELLARS